VDFEIAPIVAAKKIHEKRISLFFLILVKVVEKDSKLEQAKKYKENAKVNISFKMIVSLAFVLKIFL
jgi:hypothetical protein